MSEFNCATSDTPNQSILSKIENIFGSLNQIVFENFTDSIDLFEADTFKDFTLEGIIPFHVDDRDAFWKIFTDSAQYGFKDELYEILNECEAFEEEFLTDFELKKCLNEDSFVDWVSELVDDCFIQTPYERARIRKALS